jgi:EAL domain-containing protein (putative c-di-GMP-specific phosphodiesterase class I)
VFETDAQLAMLLDLGCEHGQGYLFTAPLPIAAAKEHLRSSWPRW